MLLELSGQAIENNNMINFLKEKITADQSATDARIENIEDKVAEIRL